jgi:predicted aldo/keto reductase-like oxidoreductase
MSRVKRVYDEKIKVGCTACGYCMPCPSGVNIPSVFRTYNCVAIGGDVERFRKIYDSMLIQQEADATQCTECGECEEACPQNLPIIRQLKEAHEALT